MAKYQTANDVRMQDRVAGMLSPHFDVVVSTRDTCRFDYVLYNQGTPPMLLEVKTRYVGRGKWKELKVDKDKVDEGLIAAQKINGKFFLAAHWADDVGLLEIEPGDSFKVGSMTLRKPRDANDVSDAVYLIPVERFFLLHGWGHGIFK